MWPLYVTLGVAAGIASGFFGIGGGTVLIPILVYALSLPQHQAQGTALAAMLPPVFFLAVMRYYLAGNVKVNIALFICLGVLFGGFIGASLAHKVSGVMLKRLFGIYLLFVSLKMILSK